MEDTPVASENGGSESPKKSKKPANTAFKQQRLPAWQPVMTAKTVIPTFFIIGIIFVPLGAVLFTTSEGVKEHVIDYTFDSGCKRCYDDLNTTGAHEDSYVPCTCSIDFTLSADFESPVYLYYGLDNFYQNHRRYVRSRDDTQLLGTVMDSLNDDCKPYKVDENKKLIAPCGAIANSMFNDTLSLRYNGSIVPLVKKGIAWPTDREAKFKNPEFTAPANFCDAKAFLNTVKPPNWRVPACQLDTEDQDNNGFRNEDFIVWMRTAALPNFRKLYRKVNHTLSTFENGLPAGSYKLDVVYNYPVKAFEGRKKMILSTVSWLGGKNPFLGIAYIVVGAICILLAVGFLVIHFRIGKSTEEVIEVTNRTPYM